MQKDFHVILVEPRIPQNTGNIGRLCVACGASLHLIHPLGFSISQKEIKRAGLDYWQYLQVFEWANLKAFWETFPLSSNHFFLSTKAKKVIFDAPLQNGAFFYFGREDKGLDSTLLESNSTQVYKLPMTKNARSINLATAVSATLFEGVRQSRNY
ncbi:tRNA (cytidine(34)-2'-O)-methyltransferase [Helicobacter saguini]|uniref:Putative tRNA (cytidine(34)-2'-O)-methyltransferase n=1 Tax=Helicobacter saguini TaxID=1548018 RepID=A0A347VNW5_9HELI|nr:tRNA (cytidine(34)-2'-O)-methyltransferase [Helicobacter saguini]MWV61610.1 tRNA (cytidine(34)-2'-O)-methyltransferase [Helicobacter saguini]MWV67718.1 tRNA (cytidine(34)-2'-O)-methyltransferase [Helicobacter saguini]MWV70070.1 tRNA (cytidine(34)-2'-O)-methyltransferase [Helicobacter saguini]MWV72717.1 tRNA (cytidine(34)-2'-O)-methyltransferase [Helicobacter saguini]TLD92019.1 tRNA (cytidine(34)-2'-O)-methyltransferase [Helicobacter saguini]